MQQFVARPFGILTALIGLLAAPTSGLAHPHILPIVRADIIFEGARASAVKQTWTYDAAYSSFATRNIDANKDGTISPEELASFAKGQLDALAEHNYFTAASTPAGTVKFGSVHFDQIERIDDGRLRLTFTLPFKSKVAAEALQLIVEIFDPNFFAYFTMADGGVRLVGAHDDCAQTTVGPKTIDLSHTRSIPRVFWDALDGSKTAGQAFVNRITVTCR